VLGDLSKLKELNPRTLYNFPDEVLVYMFCSWLEAGITTLKLIVLITEELK
jgi:hypothetical protein